MIRSEHCASEGGIKCPLILLRPYQCSQSRIIEMLRQGVRGSELFRVIFSSGIPMPCWLPVAFPKPSCFFSLSPFLITLGIQRQSEVFKSALLRNFS